jgi:hypothetical protein
MSKKLKFITGEELANRWDTNLPSLQVILESLEKRIEVYLDGGSSWDPDEGEKKYYFPTDDGAPDYQSSVLSKVLFPIETVEAIEKEHPEYLPNDSPYVSKQGETPPYLDRNNNYFSKELKIAITTWMKIYSKGGALNPEQKHKKQIISYLKKHYPDLTKSAVNRIATMINADTAGAPSSIYTQR